MPTADTQERRARAAVSFTLAAAFTCTAIYLSVGCFKEQLLAIPAPARLLAAGNRNGPLALA